MSDNFLYNNIKYYMDARHLTVEGLSKKTGIPTQTLYSYLQGKRDPSLKNAVKIGDALYCTVYDLFYEEPNIYKWTQ